MTDDDVLDLLRTRRGVLAPCAKCYGWGVCFYSSTATWRGGMGGQAVTRDVCDLCWGSGDSVERGTDLRALAGKIRALEIESSRRWFSERSGAAMSSMRPHMLAVASELDRMARKRTAPAGLDLFWHRRYVEALASVLRELVGEP